ncbi:hypothetical protein HY17_15345 [Hyphomonas sp. CY54-11-8]|nr:hypothetical protein HY17_15345 [Hyphomonas sp. CY54-11-8]
MAIGKIAAPLKLNLNFWFIFILPRALLFSVFPFHAMMHKDAKVDYEIW